jgi:hypothetical protein
MVAGTAGDCSARGDQLIAISAQGMHDIGLASLADVRLVGESPRADVEVGGGQVVLSADGQLRPDDDVTIFDIASGLFAPGRIVVNRAVQPK